jgi:signal transduction histidine kinase
MHRPTHFDPVKWTQHQPVRWVIPFIYVGCGLAFLTDITHDVSLFFGLFYVPLICTAIFYRSSNSVWWLAGFSTGLIIVGFFLPSINHHVALAIANRFLQIAGIWITALLVRHTRVIQDRLAAETTRAEAAERVKTIVFSNLSDDMRQPLHGMIGATSLMMADCRPDQRAPLQQVQSGSRRLLGTIENLIDLTHLDDRAFTIEAVDIGAVLSRAAERARPTAIERQVSLSVRLPERGSMITRADPWAVRRIADNLISNAVKFSRPGGTVVVAVEGGNGSVTASVQDTGIGMSYEVVRQLGQPFYQPNQDDPSSGTGTGLALCRRLADAIGGELAFVSEPGIGTMATLRLPAGSPA